MTDRQARKLIYAVIEANKNRFNDDALEALEMGRTALEQPTVDVLEQIRAEIAEYKDDKIIHAERNEMIDIVLEIIDKYMK